MRTPTACLLLALILFAACASSSGTSSGNGPDYTIVEEDDRAELPSNVPRVTNQRVRLEWRNLKPGRPDAPIGLINQTSPEMRELWKKPSAYTHVKPVKDDIMAATIEALRQAGYYDHAQTGLPLEGFEPAAGQIGVIHVTQGEKTSYLIFGSGMAGTGLPEVYRDCRAILIEVHRRTFWLAPAKASDMRLPEIRRPRR